MKPRALFFATTIIMTAVLAGGLFYFEYSRRERREEALKRDLQTVRQAIDNYTMDKREAPQSLEDLVSAHYIREIPIDPVCEHRIWNTHFGDTVLPSEQMTAGLDDVYSGCSKVGSNGTPYSTW
jgi:general secretion pathway protein G